MNHVQRTRFTTVLALAQTKIFGFARSHHFMCAILFATLIALVQAPSSFGQSAPGGRERLLRGDYDHLIPEELSVISNQRRIAAPSFAAASSTEVYPTGIYPDDVVHVQTAVDQGGKVLLKATNFAGTPLAFNFGPPVVGGGAVFLERAVTIAGEIVNGQMTQINGGQYPIRCFAPIDTKIRDIDFEGPRGAAIIIFGSTGVEITGNTIRNVVDSPSGGIPFGRGIWVAGIFSTADVRGRVVIAHNTIDGVTAWASYGISVAFLDAQVSIVDNSVSRINLNGILVGNNTHAATIMRNTVIPGPQLGPDDFTAGNGIFVGHSRGGAYHITNNKVICDNIWADGIAFIGDTVLLSDNSEVISNDVTMHDSFFGAISLYDVVSTTHVNANKISGDGGFAMQIGAFLSSPPGSAVSNSFISNDISNFESAIADVLLDSNSARTTLVGHGGTVIDLGTNNRIVGFTKL